MFSLSLKDLRSTMEIECACVGVCMCIIFKIIKIREVMNRQTLVLVLTIQTIHIAGYGGKE